MPLLVTHSAEEWLSRLGPTRNATALTIGNFDGVHRGHQQILRSVQERARTLNLVSAVLTFHPHPARVLRPQHAPSLLMTLDQRLQAIDALGIDAAFVLRFDEAIAKLTPDEFVRQFLAETMRARAVLVGENFRFGHRQAGDVKVLTELGQRYGFDCEVVPPVIVDGLVVSSTAIRNALRDGQMELAADLLGRPFELAGEIRTGTGQGRKLVVPTLNLSTEQEALPRKGVYATETDVAGATYRSVTNIGVRPTFDGHQLAIESHLFGFSENLTSGPMQIRFFARLRDEQKFSGPQALREQILRDIEKAKEYFAASAPRR
jgi:riboflavin kinase / FMN adenylyltransferase